MRKASMRALIHADSLTLAKDGTYTARFGFFYTHGLNAEHFVKMVRAAFPAATVLTSGEVWKPFKGSAPVSRQSHWFVTFTMPGTACDHNAMVERVGNTAHAWQCAKCGHVYGRNQ